MNGTLYYTPAAAAAAAAPPPRRRAMRRAPAPGRRLAHAPRPAPARALVVVDVWSCVVLSVSPRVSACLSAVGLDARTSSRCARVKANGKVNTRV